MVRADIVRVLRQIRHRVGLLNHLKFVVCHGFEEVLSLPCPFMGENAHAPLLQHSSPLGEHGLVGLVQIRQSPNARHRLEGRVRRGVQRLAEVTLDCAGVHLLIIHKLLARQLQRLAADVETDKLTSEPSIAHFGAGHTCSTPKICDSPVQGDVLGQHLSSHLRGLISPGDQGVIVGSRPVIIQLGGALGVLRRGGQSFPRVKGRHGCGLRNWWC
mmetsp:Transcript_9317/g.20317  ORF Transcript_9317/g.20317 Transcript_9317/m.20317 type:complete len:215 (-) Transcript_9317:15-659(-)